MIVGSPERKAIIKEYLPAGLVDRSDSGKVVARPGVPQAVVDGGLARFLLQYRVLGDVRHPAIVGVRECFRLHGTGYAVMECVDGETLAARLADGKTLSPHELRTILFPILEGLGRVHGVGLVHAAINLENIVIQPDGSPVLLGFDATPGGAGPRQAFGSRVPALVEDLSRGYAAVEQYSRQGQQGPWTDVYGLGAVAYRCMTGSTPLDAPVRAVQDDLIPASEAARGSFDQRLLAGVDRALALRAANRPRTLGAWRRILDASGTREGAAPSARGRFAARQSERPMRNPTQADGPNPTSTTSGLDGPEGARRGLTWAVPALMAVALITLLTWVDTRVLRSGDAQYANATEALSGTVGGADTRRARDQSAGTEAMDSAGEVEVPGPARESAGTGAARRQRAQVRDTRLLSPPEPPSESEQESHGTPATLAATVESSPRTSESDRTGTGRRTTGRSEPEVAAQDPGRGTPEDSGPTRLLDQSATAVLQPVEERPDAEIRHGTLTLDLFPANAEVRFLDDSVAGYRPGMKVPEGQHRVRVSGAGYLPETHTLAVAGATRARIALLPQPQPFSVSSIPPGATVRFAHGSAGYLREMLLPPGNYQVGVALAGYESWEGTVAHGTAPTNWKVALARSFEGFADRLASGNAGPRMVIVPPGTFQMGCVSGRRCFNNEFPVLDVAVEAPFAMSKFEITVVDFELFRGGRAEGVGGPYGGTEPVVGVSWADAAAYAAWLSSETGRPYRLPTESEWEYAARAQTTTAYSWGSDPGDGRANCSGCDGGSSARSAVPVGSFDANAWGLHDMHGNVWEWVLDCPLGWRLQLAARAAQAEPNCQRRVRRGGSWAHSSRRMRGASRDIANPELRSPNTGFRVLLELQ